MIKIACLLAIFITSSAHAQSYFEFVENKGQWGNEVKFRGNMANGAFALQPSGYRVAINNAEEIKAAARLYHGDSHDEARKGTVGRDPSLTVHGHAYEVKFLNSNPNAVIVPEKPITAYNNYFIGNDPSKWASNCKIYQAVTYKNIYPNIDVRYYTGNNNLKYDIIVNPGGDASKIAMYFDGVDALRTKNGELVVKTSVGDVRELAPYSYQVKNTGKKEVNCSYDVKGNILRFKISDNIDKAATLVIDPTLIFSTFTGSSADNWGYTATYDALGNFYAGGIVFGPGFPVSNGAFQTTFQGGNNSNEGAFDIGIMKFTPDGTNRIYATYIGGGDGNEQPHSLVVDNVGNLIISGRTNASTYPTTLPTLGSGGSWDIILTKLNADGTNLIASRKIGGTGDDGVNIRPKYQGTAGDESLRRNYGDDARSEVIIDASNNVYLASCTQSTNFPTTGGAAQENNGGTTSATARFQDAVVIKTTPNLSNILFSTFIGGSGDDAAFVLALNPSNNNIYVAGGTTSTNMPGNFSSPIFASNKGGVTEGFVQVLSNDGSAFLQSAYIGTDGIDIIYGIQFDKFSYPYIMGTTTGSWPVMNVAFSQPNGKQFISKLKKDLSGFEYSTVWGSNNSLPNISPTAFLVDRCENVYVSGWGGKINKDYATSPLMNGLSVTPDAYKATTDGSDFYFIVLERNAASQLYGSYFGQTNGSFDEHVDGGTSRFDRQGTIYQAICANCEGGAVFPTTPGAWSEVNGSNNRCNLAAIKIAFNLAGVGSAIQSSLDGRARDTSGCVPLEVSFRDTIAEGKKYVWDFGDGSPSITTTDPNTTHTYNFVGSYRVMLVSIDSAKCNIADTSYLTMRVRNDDADLAFDAIKQLPCNSLNYNFINNSVPPTGKPFKSNSFKWDFGDNTPTQITGNQTINHSYAAPGTYIVKMILIDTNYCNEPDTVVKTLRVAPLVKAQFETPPSGCAPYTALFTNTSLAGTDFIWDFGDGSPVSTDVNPSHLYGIGNYTIKLIAIDTATCNKIDSTTFSIVVSDKPTSGFTYLPNPPQENTPVDFTNTSTGGASYKWLYGDGDSLVTTSTGMVSHLYNATQTFQACLIVTNVYGCRDTTCKPVQIRIKPSIDVPNAFTPNGDGLNDVAYIQGFGIEKMVWRIYNRWGVLVFTSTSKNLGWDGRYKGVIQPQDVYSYSLEVEYSDGERYSTKGDLTLLR